MESGYLAKVLADLGPESCDRNMFLDILQQLSPMLVQGGIEGQVGHALVMMCRPQGLGGGSPRTPSPTWNTMTFGSAVLESFPKIDANQVFAGLDVPQFAVADPRGAELVFRGLRAMSKDFYSQLQIKSVVKPWTNVKGQLSLVFNSLLLPPDVLNFSTFVGRKVIAPEDFTSLSPAARSIAATLSAQTWNSMDLFEYTAQVIDTESFEDAKPIFELASRQCPELLCIALASMDPTWNSINKEILVKLTCGFLLGQPSSSVVLPRVWALNPNVLLFCMVEMHRRDATCLSRLLDVAQELKILPVILDAKPYTFALDLACLASRRQHLNIEKWLMEAVKDKGETFLRAAVEFVSDKVASQYGRSRGGGTSGVPPNGIPVAPEVLTVFVKVLAGAFASMPPDVAEQFREVHRALSAELSPTSAPVLSPDRPSGAAVDSLPEMSFAADVEEEVNSFFDRIFARDISIPEVVEVLRRLKASTNIRNQQVFACFLHNIFDEFRFFAKYPENELNLTAVLFGQLVNCDLVSAAVPMQLALRCILEALKKPPSQKLFRFGLQALLQFHGRLSEMPQFCAQLMQIPNLQQVYPDLFNYIRGCMSGQTASPTGRFTEAVPGGGGGGVGGSAAVATPSGGGGPVSSFGGGGSVSPVEPSSPAGAPSSFGENPLVEAAEKQKLAMPAEGVRDRILFIMNNLSLGNLENKANDLVKVLEEAHFAWLAQYLVVRRASLEPNYHGLYLGFLDILQLHPLTQAVLTQTYGSIYVLLRSTKIVASSAERSLLKNLGSWLGGLTVARDRPILYRDLSLKDLLIEAVGNDRLIAIVPFVCKVVEQCAHSRAFQPENPWLMALLRLLAELYNLADLKLNLKFEIEVLCKNLSVDLHAIEPSSILKPKVPAAMPSRGDGGAAFPWTESVLTHLVVLTNGRLQGSRASAAIKKLVALAIEYAIRDVALSVAQRSLQYALTTTRTVAGKDFAGEPDRSVYRHAATSMALALTANMAVVLARESLRGSIINNVRVFAQWAGLGHFLGEAVIEGIAEDNTDLASAYIEKISLERSRPQIEQIVEAENNVRPRSATAPKMTADQARVYDEFARKARPAHLTALPPISLDPPSAEELERLAHALAAVSASNKMSGEARAEHIKADAAAALLSPGVPAVDGSLDAYFETVCLKFVELVASIERLVPSAAAEADAVSKLPTSHEIRTLMKQIVMLASSSPIHRDELCLLMSQRLMQGLYKTDAPLYVDILILLLIKIFEFSSKAAKEVTTWVVHSTDERKYSVLATAALFGSGLIYVLDFDGQLAKQIEHGSSAATSFAVELIRRCVFGEPSVAAPYDFVYSLEALGKLVQEEPAAHASVSRLLHDIAAMVKAPQPESQLLRDQITFCFTDWFRLCQYPSISEKLISSFVAQLFQRRFLADEAAARPFFQICIELAIELYVRQRRAPAILAYRSIDAFARLVGQIIKFHPGPADGIEALRIVTIVHSVAGLILVQGLDQGLDYLQRPFARLFGSLASEVLHSGSSSSSSDGSWAIVENLSTFYSMIGPSSYPNFAFGWFELIANRDYLPMLLFAPERRGWPILAHLLSEYLEFASPMLQDYDAHESTRAMYRGILRTLLVLLHDAPEFFVVYGRALSLLVPPAAIQLRNTLFSAVPESCAALPDPLTAKVTTTFARDAEVPQRSAELAAQLAGNIKTFADEFIHNPQATQAARQLLQAANNPNAPRAVNGWSLDVLGRSIAYLGLAALSGLSEGADLTAAVRHSPASEFVRFAMQETSDPFGRYAIVCALADQLAYPSMLTSYFYVLILCLFAEAPHELVKEVITRVLLERLIVHRPHPWGVMVTFIELVKNPQYRFWDLAFTRATPDIERVFEAISRSCLGGAPTLK